MADRELAAKLAKRLACVQEPEAEDANQLKSVPPPPVPIIPQKIIENPYVAVDNSISIDDLIQKTLERKEENNNNVPPPVPSSPIPPIPPSAISEAPANLSPTKAVSSPTVPPPPPPSTVEASSNSSPVPTSCSPVPTPCSPSPSTAKPAQGIPPKTTIRDLLQKEYDNNLQNIQVQSKCPIVSIQHHKRSSTPTRKEVESDGSELEKKLAAQRNKKIINPLLVEDTSNNLIYSHDQPSTVASNCPPPTPAKPCTSPKAPEVKDDTTQTTPMLPDFPPPPPFSPPASSEVASSDMPLPPPPPKPVRVQEDQEVNATTLPPQPSAPEEDSKTMVVDTSDPSEDVELPRKKDSFEELEEMFAKEAEEEEAKQREATQQKLEEISDRPYTPAKSPELLRTALRNVPSPLLIEMIKTECGNSSRPSTPPPVPPPKPQSRPQSPVVRKPIVSPLGLLCDPLMSVEDEKPIPSPPIKKCSPKVENPDELNAMLERRTKILEGDVQPQFINRKLSVFAEFSEFSRKQIKFFQDTFKKFDEDCDGFIDFNELKRMMEKLGEAQTHIALKDIIKKVDEDNDGKISLREFFLLFRLAAQGQFGCSEVFTQLAESVDVAKEGVLAAASFFQAKIAEQTKLSKFEEEIKQEQDEKRQEEEEKRKRREKFLQNKSIFH